MTTQHKITITELPIRLGQFLKFANLVQDGFEAKIRIQHGEVCLNGQVETQRGKQLAIGDVISYQGQDYCIETADK
jgi:ribosome-associated protein